MTQILFITHDAGPSKDLGDAAAVISSKGLTTSAFLGYGTEHDLTEVISDILAAVAKCDLVVAGMDSSPELAAPALAAIEHAHKHNIPVILYGDNWDTVARLWFESVRHIPQGLMVLDESERQIAGDLFPNAVDNIIVTGCPRWALGAHVPISREVARAELGIDEDEKVVVVPFTKNYGLNLDLLAALERLIKEFCVRGFASFHPGDTTNRTSYRRLAPNVEALPEKSTKRYLPAADVVLNGTSSTGVDAAMQGIPVIEYKAPAILAEEARIYPNGWRLPQSFPELMREATEETLLAVAGELLQHEIKWIGKVAVEELPTPKSTLLMADAITKFLNAR